MLSVVTLVAYDGPGLTAEPHVAAGEIVPSLCNGVGKTTLLRRSSAFCA